MFNAFDERNLPPNGIYAIVDVISTSKERQLQGQEVIYCIHTLSETARRDHVLPRVQHDCGALG